MPHAIDRLTELQQRILIALPGAGLVLGAIYWNQWTYCLLFGGLCFLTQREFYQMLAFSGYHPFKTLGLTTGLLLYLFLFLIQLYPELIQWGFALIVVPMFAYILQLYRPSRTPFPDVGLTFLGVFYVALPYGLMHVVSFDGGVYYFERVLAFMCFLWATDTGAYFSGRFLGRHKLFVRVSPNKTWEGSIGGVLLAMLIGYGVSFLFDSLTPTRWVGMAFVVALMGIYGDLVESQLKRSLRIKNSGKSLPGHGGFMDRFDGLLLAVPGVMFFLELLKRIS
ncbi:MAG: phosphatidate cytidylyltransferase [Bernardetiaceae bacterium]